MVSMATLGLGFPLWEDAASTVFSHTLELEEAVWGRFLSELSCGLNLVGSL